MSINNDSNGTINQINKETWTSASITEKRHMLVSLFLSRSWSRQEWSDHIMQHVIELHKLPSKIDTLLFSKSSILDITEYTIENAKCDLLNFKKELIEISSTQEKAAHYIYQIIWIFHKNYVYLPDMLRSLNKIDVNMRKICYIQRICWQFADLFWISIEDKSLDFNYYSKRLVLSRIINRIFQKISTMRSFSLSDNHNFEDSPESIRNIIDDELSKTLEYVKFFKKLNSNFGLPKACSKKN